MFKLKLYYPWKACSSLKGNRERVGLGEGEGRHVPGEMWSERIDNKKEIKIIIVIIRNEVNVSDFCLKDIILHNLGKS